MIRSDRRTLALIVAIDGSVRVRAPRCISQHSISRFVDERAAWVVKKRHAAVLRRQAAPRYESGEEHPYLGQGVRLAIEAGERDEARHDGEALRVTLAGERSPERVKHAIDEWYRAEAARQLPARLEACWATFARPGEAMPQLRVRLMHSRWGSLTAAGRISLNAYLMRAPAECIDAVIFHELCHLRVRGHGPEFYRELARYVPEWRMRRRQLRGTLHPHTVLA